MRQKYCRSFLQAVLDNYASCGQIQLFSLFASGFENSNYYIKSTTGEFVIKIFDGVNVTKENILFEISLMMYCHALKVPHVYKTKKQKDYVEHNGKIAIVMEYIIGENCFKKKITDPLITQIGDEAGKMDVLLQQFDQPVTVREHYEWDLTQFMRLESALSLLPSHFDKSCFKKIFMHFKKIQPVFDKLPKQVIHNDIAAHNILVKGNTLRAIIDFSDAAYAPCIQNVAVFFTQTVLSYNWNLSQIPLFLEVYTSHIQLSEQELSLLYNLICARFATIVIEFNRWNNMYGADAQRTEYVEDHYAFLQKFLLISEQEFTSLITCKKRIV
jgi:Ser/Thr protein kinase RdoA (MazF antagonist)